MSNAATMWWRVAGVSGASSVALAAYGAHGLQDLDPKLKTTFDAGNRMHMQHSVMLAICPLLKRPHTSGALFLTGIAIFSGSAYAAALTKDRANGRFAPYGGSMLIAGWLSDTAMSLPIRRSMVELVLLSFSSVRELKVL